LTNFNSIWSIDCAGALSAGIINILAFEFSFVQTPNRGTLMVANYEFDQVLGPEIAKRGVEKRMVMGTMVGSVKFCLDLRPMPVVGKRGPKPRSADVLNLGMA
jgi:hypothetical protein